MKFSVAATVAMSLAAANFVVATPPVSVPMPLFFVIPFL